MSNGNGESDNVRIENLLEKVAFIEKRTDDFSSHRTASTALFVFVVTALNAASLVKLEIDRANINADQEKLEAGIASKFSEQDKRVQQALGSYMAAPADVALLTPEGEPLSGSTLTGTLSSGSDESINLELIFAYRNIGEKREYGYRVAIYGNDPLTFTKPSIDDNGFKYTSYDTYNESSNSLLPGRASGRWKETFYLSSFNAPSLEISYPVRLELYYGDGQVATARFNLKLE